MTDTECRCPMCGAVVHKAESVREELLRQARKDKAMIDALSPRAREILNMREERPRQERDWWDR